MCVRGDNRLLNVVIRTPQPLVTGVNSMELTVTDNHGNPVDGLTVNVVPWMSTMNHGSTSNPVVSPQGNGTYSVTNVVFIMPGPWDLQTTFTGPVSDYVAPTVQIP
ncbi:MAG: FixH family protein [Polyangiaceae bacterium]|nr:FixH family protein [Polyangiaceae bacterium]